jgi:uridylate kinase
LDKNQCLKCTRRDSEVMRIVISIGGSVLFPELSKERVKGYAEGIDQIVSEGHSMGIVVGGGKIAREYIGVAREFGSDEITLDQIGIAVTRVNAQTLMACVDYEFGQLPPESYESAKHILQQEGMVIMGGIAPGQTTDAVGAALAEYSNADLLIYATSVDGVYSSDPKVDENATKFDKITPSELIEIIVGTEMVAGNAAPVDLLAAKLIERSRIKTIVIDGSNPKNMVDAVLHDKYNGTIINSD